MSTCLEGVSRSFRSLAAALLVGACAVTALDAQTIDELRERVREAAGAAHLTTLVAGLVDLSENDDVSAGRLTITPGPDLDVDTWKLPWRRNVPLGDGRSELHLEAGIGYFVSRSATDDVWGGGLPGLEAGLRTRWEGVSGFVGAGPRFDFGSGFHAGPVVDVSLSYVENDALWSGPGAAQTEALLDGVLFDWHATTVAYGVAGRLEHELPIAELRSLTSLLRYDVRGFDGIDSSDEAQDFDDTIQRVVVSSTYEAPTGLSFSGGPVLWELRVAYTRYLGNDEDVLGFTDYYEVGCALESPSPILQTMRLSGALLFGEDVRGWSLGFSLTF